MKKNTIFYFILFLTVIAGCKKIEFEETPTGEALGSFALVGPGNNLSVNLNSATPNAQVVIEWTAAPKGVNTAPKYKWIASQSTGSLSQPLIEIASDNNGQDTKLTLTHKQIDDALAAKNIAAGQTANLIWSVVADNGSTQVRANQTNNISIRRFGNGTTPFTLLGPSNSTTPVTVSPGSTTDSVRFNWTRSMPATGSPAVRYSVSFYKDDNSTTPVFVLPSNRAGVDTVLSISYKDFSDTLTKYGFTNMAQVANLRWNVMASSGTWNESSSFSNQFYVVREVKLFMVGGATPIGWTPTNALQLREDKTKPGVFYIYTELKTGNNGFKFLSMRADWNASGQTQFGENNSAETSGNVPSNNTGVLRAGGENIAVPSGNGIYRVTVDLNQNRYYVQTATSNGIGGMGMIGSFMTPQWTQPAVKMDYVSVNRFNYLVNMNNGDGFKFHDGNDWDNSGANKHRWFGLNGTTLGEDPGNFSDIKYNGPTGLARVIWDGTDVNNMRYTVIPGRLYAIGGDAGLGNWNNSAGNASMPEFTYLGNGRWSATITVSSGAPFKLVMEKGNWDLQWGAGNTAGTMGTMVMRYYDADPPTFNFPSAGTYTVMVDEYAGTISW
jgi:hypothetical protein